MSAESPFKKGQIVRHKLMKENCYIVLKVDLDEKVLVRGEDSQEYRFYPFELEPLKEKVTKLREGKKSA